jgi:hypothetical protein
MKISFNCLYLSNAAIKKHEMTRIASLFFASVFGTTFGAFLKMKGYTTAGTVIIILSGIALITVFLLLIVSVVRGNQTA